jgi:tRNA modification GTPase
MSGQSSRSRLAEQALPGADTIAAPATAPGRAALATIRVSGADANNIGAACVRPWPLAPRVATLAVIRHPVSHDVADSAVATWFPAPRSFTGEDVLEVTTHGGTIAPASVMAAFVRAGARPALPGEFTRRAVLNGKLDLLQAEAIGDLIDAASGVLHRAALAQLSGALTGRISALRKALIDLEALLAYDIDFPDEDDGPVASSLVSETCRTVQGEIDRLLSTLPVAQLGQSGAVVVLAGVPNSGKSSLFNALIGEQRAIVTEHPGTTRDAIDVFIEAEPYPWRLVDTAGLRGATDPVERLGVEVSGQWLARADVVLICGTRAHDRGTAEAGIRGRTTASVVRVQTMVDASESEAGADVAVSAMTGHGLDALRHVVGETLAVRHPRPPADTPVITRARHERALSQARGELTLFLAAWESRTLPATIAATHVHAAILALDSLIGAVDLDEVLDRVFARFCVGK